MNLQFSDNAYLLTYCSCLNIIEALSQDTFLAWPAEWNEQSLIFVGGESVELSLHLNWMKQMEGSFWKKGRREEKQKNQCEKCHCN